MYKAVVFSRVSTVRQNFAAQTEDVKHWALQWYDENDILTIEYQESGAGFSVYCVCYRETHPYSYDICKQKIYFFSFFFVFLR